jgi:hypothetical protein
MILNTKSDYYRHFEENFRLAQDNCAEFPDDNRNGKCRLASNARV